MPGHSWKSTSRGQERHPGLSGSGHDFLTASSDREYEQRLRRRGTETEEAIRRRMAIARKELAASGFYRYHVVNDELDRAVDEIAEFSSHGRTN